MIEQVLNRRNVTQALRHVVSNKGSAGIDKMPVKELYAYLSENRERIESELRQGKYQPQPIRGRAERKENVQRTFLAKSRFAGEDTKE